MVNFKTVLTIMTIVSTSEKKSEYTGKISRRPGRCRKVNHPHYKSPPPPSEIYAVYGQLPHSLGIIAIHITKPRILYK